MSNEIPSGQYRLLQGVNLISFMAVVVVNFLANYLPINGLDTGYISDLYPNLFTPAGFTFSIWGLIYLMLGIFAVYQARRIHRADSEQLPFVGRIGYLFFISSVCNVAWIFAWHYLQIGLSLVLMVLLFLSLICLYKHLNRESSKKESPWTIAVHLAFSLYLGWITIATVANVTVFLVDINWGQFGLSEAFWMVAVTLVSTGIVLSFMFKNRDWIYGLVGLWAFFGILLKRLGAESIATLVVVVVVFCMVVLAAGILMTIHANKKTLNSTLPYAKE